MEWPLTQRLALMFTFVKAGVAEQIRFRRLTGEMIVRICNHLAWIERHLRIAMAHAAAGRKPRPTCPRAPRDPDTQPATRKPSIRKAPLPRREGWLLPLVPAIAESRHAAAIYGNGLRANLADPEMAPYLSHPSVIRALRPICRMLGISDALPAKPPRPKPAEPAGRTGEAPSATATRAVSVQPGSSPAAHPPSPKPRPVRRIPPRRLRLPLPRLV